MRRDSRLSVALHVLLHLDSMDEVVPSETLGPLMKLNPAVVRRTFAGLREAGILRAEKGHGGGWCLARDLAEVTLADVYGALGEPTLFAIGPREESPGCLVEQAVNRALGQALDKAEAALLAQLGDITVADLAAEARRRGWKPHLKGAHDHA